MNQPTLDHRPRWCRFLSRLFHIRPGLSRNVAAAPNYATLAKLLKQRGSTSVLIVGCGDGGAGLEALVESDVISTVGIDVRFCKEANIICDGQQLPFTDQAFDGIILQGVLEHIFDPLKVEAEVYRTLKSDGLVYCELPFMQPNHGGPFDFIRLTSVGHRRFWRRFSEINAGICCGPGMTLARTIQQFVRTLFPSHSWRLFADWLCDWSLWWLKYLDGWLVKNPASIDVASAFYFLGQKSCSPLSDNQLASTYRGMQ